MYIVMVWYYSDIECTGVTHYKKFRDMAAALNFANAQRDWFDIHTNDYDIRVFKEVPHDNE